MEAVSDRLNKENTTRAIVLFTSLTKPEGDWSDAECKVVEQFLRDCAPEVASESDMAEWMAQFKRRGVNYQTRRNELFMLSKSLPHKQVKPLVTALNRLAVLIDSEDRAVREVSEIGEKLGLALSDIRNIAMEAKKGAGIIVEPASSPKPAINLGADFEAPKPAEKPIEELLAKSTIKLDLSGDDEDDIPTPGVIPPLEENKPKSAITLDMSGDDDDDLK